MKKITQILIEGIVWYAMLLTVIFLSLMIRAQPIYTFINDGPTNQHNFPQFDGQIAVDPLKPRIGNDVILSCPVKNLATYNIHWTNVDKQTLLVVQNVVLTDNPRIGIEKISRGSLSNWRLIIRNISMSDSGYYMCRINTEPPKRLLTFVKIYVALQFDNNDSFESDSIVEVRESEDLNITCKAIGSPKPKITWRKQDGLITLNSNTSEQKERVESEVLHMEGVSRSAIGDYLCIASNEIDESIRRKFTLQVYFSPTIKIPIKAINGFVNESVTFKCIVESNPLDIYVWTDRSGLQIDSTQNIRHSVKTIPINKYKVDLLLTIDNIQMKDSGKYFCISRNILSNTASYVTLRVKELTTTTTTTTIRSNWISYYIPTPKTEESEDNEESSVGPELVPTENYQNYTNSNQLVLMNKLNQILMFGWILVIHVIQVIL